MFEAFESDARKFVEEVAIEMDHPGNQQTAMRVMTAVFHTIRDIITVEESLHLISQLPLYIKGLYVAGWHSGEKRRKRVKDKDDLVEQLLLQNERTGPHDFGTSEKALMNTRAVIRVLKKHVTPGLIGKIAAQFPSELKDLWYEDAIVISPL